MDKSISLRPQKAPKAFVPRNASPASTSKSNRTPVQSVWYAECQKLRVNVLDIMKLFMAKNGSLSSEVLDAAGAYDRGYNSKSEIEAYKTDLDMRRMPIIADRTQRDCHKKFAFYIGTEPMYILDRFLSDILCYSNLKKSVSIGLTDIIYKDAISSTVVVRGTYIDSDDESSRNVVIKYAKNNTLINKEAKMYKLISELSDHLLPWHDLDVLMWGEPVLVVESMVKLDSDDDPHEVGIDIVEILKHIHEHLVHSDIKPSNIMKRLGEHGDWEYKLIDYGGSTTKRNGSNFYRYAMTKYFANVSNFEQVTREGVPIFTTPKNELLELLFTLRSMELGANAEKPSSSAYKNCKTGFKGKLLKYHEYWKNLPECPEEYQYDNLKLILQGEKIKVEE